MFSCIISFWVVPSPVTVHVCWCDLDYLDIHVFAKARAEGSRRAAAPLPGRHLEETVAGMGLHGFFVEGREESQLWFGVVTLYLGTWTLVEFV